MRIAFTGDGQVDERARFDEFVRVHDFMAHDAIERGCSLFLHGGDVFERRSTAKERAAVHGFLQNIASMPVVIVGGNHEAPGEVEELELISPNVHAMERPQIVEVGDVAVACLPWPRRSSLAAWVGKPLGREELNAVGLDALRSILRGFAQEWKDWKGPKILLGHLQIAEAKAGVDQPVMPGADFSISVEDLGLAEATVNLAGHYHRPQDWIGANGVPTIYAGSPRRTAYASGELEPKGYVVLEFDGPRLVKWERVPTPATPMILIEAEWDGSTFRVTKGFPVDSANWKGAEVRLRYTVDADNRQLGRQNADTAAHGWRLQGVAEVKVEEVVRPRSVARLAAVAGDAPLSSKILHIWDRDQVPAERRPSLLARLSELEGGGA